MRKKCILICFFFCLLLQSNTTYCQTTYYQKFEEAISILPPSPNAAAINKYGGVNVNLNKGILSHTIPLHEIKLKDLNIPLSLNYTSNGFKVNEYASRVGFGWTLQAGGVISRTVAGHPDEGSARLILGPTGIGQNDQSYDYLLKATGGATYDTEPDVFTFSFNGYSGKFVLDSNLKPVSIPGSNLKIEISFASSDWTFKITTPEGNKFYFGGESATEKTRSETTCGKPYSTYIPTSWYLTKIETLHGQIVNFYYNSLEFQFYTGVSQSLYFDNSPVGSTGSYCEGNPYCPTYSSQSSTCTNLLRSWGYYLKKIVAQGMATINFQDNSRTDCGDIVYSEIEVLDWNNSVKGRCHLGYTTYSQRPFLTSVSKLDIVNEGRQETKLVYNDPTNLPSLNTYQQDHWGYFNGKSASSLIPKPDLYSMQWRFPTATADRSPDAAFAIKGMLSKIIYPTGGQDTIVYEGNDYYGFKQTYPPASQISKTVEGTGLKTEVTSASAPFTLSFGQEIKLDIQISINSSNGAFDSLHNKSTVDIQSTSGFTLYSEAFLPGTNTSKILFLPANSYQIVVTGRGSGFPTTATVNCQIGIINSQYTNIPTGGVRVKKVTTSDGIAQQVKRYYYNRLGRFDTSSGGDQPAPSYINEFQTRRVCCMNGMCVYDYCSHQGMYSSSQTPLGSGVSYAAVTEGFGENFENGAVEHLYTLSPDIPATKLNGDNIPGRPFTNSIHGDREIQTSIYRMNNQTLQLVKKSIYKYKVDSTELKTIQGVVVNRRYAHEIGHTTTTDLEIEEFNVAGYHHVSAWIYVDTLVESTYADAGDSAVVQTTYQYNNAQHKMLSNTKTVLSNGNTIEASSKYPSDYASITALDEISTGIKNLQANYVISVPIEKTTFGQTSGSSNKKLLGATFKLFERGQANLKEIRQIESQDNPLTDFMTSAVVNGAVNFDSRYKKQVFFDSYDAYGNVLQQSQFNNVPKSYIWDYNNALPIAEVVNAPYQDIAYTSFEAEGSGNWIKSGTTIANSGVTGKSSFNGSLNKTVTPGDYIVTLWKSSTASATVNGATGTLLMEKNNWQLYEWQLNSVSSINVSGSNIDEVRLHPKSALMNTFVFDLLIGITAQCDANNRITYYEYDGLGRLGLVRDQDNNILKKYCYNYAGQVEDCGMNPTPLWQSTGVTRCKPCPANSAYLSNIQEHQEKDNNPYSTTYNTPRWVEDGPSSSCPVVADWQQVNLYCEQTEAGQYTGNQIKVEQDKNPCSPTYNTTRNSSTVNCTTCPKPANYQPTGNYRCVQSGGVNTGAQEREEKDMESCSSTYNLLRWVSNGTNCATCPKPSNWQATGNYRCVQSGGVNTGAQEREEKDMESCSSTYNQLRWVSNGTNCATCPKPQVWQATGNYRCVTSGGVNTGLQEREEINVESCSAGGGTTRWVSNGTNCSSCPKPPVWEPTGNYRCVVDGNGNNTGAQEREEVNEEGCSVGGSTTRWVSNGTNCATCPKPQNWQPTGNYRCVKDGSNNNTGYQEREEINMEGCSAGYNTTRWVSTGYNTTSCPLPYICSSSNCSGADKKCINNSCQTGFKVYTSSEYDPLLRKYFCTYHYEWSDGSWSQNYSEISNTECPIAV